MRIKEIKDFDKDAKEADLIISDGKYEIMCYAQPFENKREESFILIAFRDDDIMRASEETCFVEKTKDGFYSYKLQGQLVNLEKKLVAIGGIFIELGYGIPKDIKQNEFIEFTVERLDYIES